MKSRKSNYVEIKKQPKNEAGDEWVFITLLNGRTRAVSFEELYYILQWIGECEDQRYNEYWHQGRQKMIEFLTEAINNTSSYEELAKKHKLKPGILRDCTQIEMFAPLSHAGGEIN